MSADGPKFAAHRVLTAAGAWNEYAASLDHLPTWMEAREAGFLITRVVDEEAERVGSDPYDKVVEVQGHRHSEPVCAWPDCRTYLTREQMAELPDVSCDSPFGGAA